MKQIFPTFALYTCDQLKITLQINEINRIKELTATVTVF